MIALLKRACSSFSTTYEELRDVEILFDCALGILDSYDCLPGYNVDVLELPEISIDSSGGDIHGNRRNT